MRLGPEQDFFENLLEAWEDSWPRPRVIVLSFPHNPTTACVDLDFMQRMVDFAREHEVLLVHDFAYADLGFDGYDPPSILQVPGATDVAVGGMLGGLGDPSAAGNDDARITPSGARTIALSIQCSSSRTLPGKSCARRHARASPAIDGAGRA